MVSEPVKKKSAHQKISRVRKATFLKTLRETGVIQWAAAAASPYARSRSSASSSFRSLMARDPIFKQQVLDAIEESNGRLQQEAWRRAVEGTEIAKYYHGERVIESDGSPAVEKVYSDQLLALLLRSRLPDEFSDKKEVNVTGTLNHKHSALTLTLEDVEMLTDDQRGKLVDILEKIATNRGELIQIEGQVND